MRSCYSFLLIIIVVALTQATSILRIVYACRFPLASSSAMVALSIVQSSNASLVATQPLVAVFVGGTSGIGSHTIRALAATCSNERNPALRVYIIGRNAKAAEEIISDCQKICPSGQFHFIRANDLALMKDVDLVCADLILNEEKEAKVTGGTPRIDILVMSQAIFKPWDPRNGRPKSSRQRSSASLSRSILTQYRRNKRRARQMDVPDLLLSHAPRYARHAPPPRLYPSRPCHLRIWPRERHDLHPDRPVSPFASKLQLQQRRLSRCLSHYVLYGTPRHPVFR